MKAPFVILLFFSFSLQAQLKEYFESGLLTNWQQYPENHWESSSQEPLHGNYSLHHAYDNAIASDDQISILHAPLYLDSLPANWRFSIRHAYYPSSENRWAVFIVSDNPAGYLTSDSNINAYVIGVNFTGNDDLLKIWKITEDQVTPVVNTGFNWQNGTSLLHGTRLDITRTIMGLWSVSIDTTGTGNYFSLLDDGIDNEITLSNYVGIQYKYSSNQDRKFWIDDLEVTGYFKEDETPPAIKRITILSSGLAEIEFTESINTAELSNEMFTVTDEPGCPEEILIESTRIVRLKFHHSFISGHGYKLSVNDCKDIYGNIAYKLEKEFTYYLAVPYDIVINEIMADPAPVEQLPDVEYIELYNTTAFDIPVTDWELAIGDKSIQLPQILFGKETFLILCNAQEANLLTKYGSVLPIEAFPVLNNEGQTITLLNSEKAVIHTISFGKKWYRSDIKSEGGWSLEMIDPKNPCGKNENWSESEYYLGGTPGFKNSIAGTNPDLIKPELLRAAATCDTALIVSFNEPLAAITTSDPFTYSVSHNIFHPVEVLPVPPDYSKVLLTFGTKFEKSLVYELMVMANPSDCAGNLLGNSYVDFGLATPPDSFNIIINEILFDARSDEEFIEIYNRSEKIIDLSSAKISLFDDYTGKGAKTIYEFSTYFQLLPHEYTVVTGNAATLQQHYHCKNPAVLLESTDMFTLPDQEGVIGIMDKNNTLIDLLIYNSDFHFELITNPTGISIERINFNNPTNDPNNWHSAAEDAGFATPGYENSQSYNMFELSSSELWLEPEVFTPDNDGKDDFITLQYHLDKPGFIASIMVFNSRGILVKQLANNMLLGTEGFLTWDGSNRNGSMEEAGIYLVYTELFSLTGSVKKFKNTCVLAIKVE
jgi:hypothetical protein